MDSREILSQNLVRYRSEPDLSQEDMAWESHMSVRGYAQIERGEVQTSLRMLDKLSRSTGLSVTELLTPHK